MSAEEVGRDRIGEVLADRYRLDDVLGHGGAGIVFSATHVLTERQVAVKLVDTSNASEANLTRLMKEARAAVRLEHPNVVEVLDMGQLPDGAMYLALQLLRGKTLAQRLKGRKKLSLEETLVLNEPIMEAVAVAHEQGLIHRDLKPGNIFLHQDGERIVPKLLDFGVVKETDPEAVRTTQVGVVLGTPHFMAPEQARGVHDLSPAVDVWAMGVVLYRSLSGFLPFRGKNVPVVLREITRGEFVPLWEHVPTLPGPIVRVIQNAMTVDRDKRYGDMGEFLRALRAAKKGEVLDAPTPDENEVSLDAVDLAAMPTMAIEDDEDTPLPTGESLEIPEYKAAHTAKIQTRRFPTAAIGILAAVILIGGAFGVWSLRESWMSPEVAPLASAAAQEPPPKKVVPDEVPPPAEVPDEVPEKVEAPEEKAPAKKEPEAPSPTVDEQVAKLSEAAKAISVNVASRVEKLAEPEPEPKIDPAVKAAQEAEAKALAEAQEAKAKALADAQEARKSALSAREKFGVVRASLIEAERRAQNSLRSTVALTRRAQEPADKRTAQRARDAAQTKYDAARSATARCEQAYRARVAGTSLDQRWRTGEAQLKKEALEAAKKTFDRITVIATGLEETCRSGAKAGGSAPIAAAAPRAMRPPPRGAPSGTSAAAPAAADGPENARAKAKAHFARAQQFRRKGSKQRALRELDEAVRLEPKFVAAYNSRGLLHRELGRPDAALADFNRAHKLEPNNAGVLNNRGYAKLAKHDLSGAIADFSAAIQRDPNNASFYENRGAARYLRGKFAEASEDFGKAIQLAPRALSAYRRRARTHQKLGNHAGAKSDLDRVIDGRPNDLDAHYARGQSLYELGKHDDAVADFDKVIRLSPKRSEAYLRRGLAYVKKGDKTHAKADFEKHLTLSPNSAHKKLIKRHLQKMR